MTKLRACPTIENPDTDFWVEPSSTSECAIALRNVDSLYKQSEELSHIPMFLKEKITIQLVYIFLIEKILCLGFAEKKSNIQLIH